MIIISLIIIQGTIMEKEYKLILLSTLINKSSVENDEIDRILDNNVDWVEVAGILLNHRLGGYFYKGLTKEQLSKLPKELRKNLQMLIKGQMVNQKNLDGYINELYETLENQGIRYAGLKGVFFGASIYPSGIRRSNDIDLLVLERDLQKLDFLMRKIGYVQSFLPEGRLVEATKKEKLIQRLNYHDLVPYIKNTNDGIIEVDINFLFDGKDNQIDQLVFEKGTFVYRGENYSFRGLGIISNLAFLITHFFREATEELWIKNKRNFTLYKIVDIVNLIRFYKKELVLYDVVNAIKELNLVPKTLFTFYTISRFFDVKLIKEYISITEMENPFLCKKIMDEFPSFDSYFLDAFKMER